MIRSLFLMFILITPALSQAQEPDAAAALSRSIEQLRSTLGKWDVVTDFLAPDGSVSKSVTGTYEFSWVVVDRVLTGKSVIPELDQASGILFYINDKKGFIEMVSVGADGTLWVMTGPLGEETRLTKEFPTTTGGTGQLRFTRFNVNPDAFESKMEYTEDGGQSWTAGNHQQFRRAERAENG